MIPTIAGMIGVLLREEQIRVECNGMGCGIKYEPERCRSVQ